MEEDVVLLISGNVRNNNSLDKQYVAKVLDQIISSLGWDTLDFPRFYSDNNVDTAFVPLQSGSAFARYSPQNGGISLALFCSKPFDYQLAVKTADHNFGFSFYREQVVLNNAPENIYVPRVIYREI